MGTKEQDEVELDVGRDEHCEDCLLPKRKVQLGRSETNTVKKTILKGRVKTTRRGEGVDSKGPDGEDRGCRRTWTEEEP